MGKKSKNQQKIAKKERKMVAEAMKSATLSLCKQVCLGGLKDIGELNKRVDAIEEMISLLSTIRLVHQFMTIQRGEAEADEWLSERHDFDNGADLDDRVERLKQRLAEWNERKEEYLGIVEDEIAQQEGRNNNNDNNGDEGGVGGGLAPRSAGGLSPRV